ncbi:MAG: threonylcarbamoyl-AMP synthase [Treponema sp.]|jgi:L-threonylcarbamoyladenylate synthase|nr:threonylcarbamoyl-AMP synthase [Treponema sp.]
MQYFSIIDDAALHAGAEALRAGELTAFPTETVYGLGADAFNTHALAKVFEAKQRPRFDPLIIHIASLDSVEQIADLSLLNAAARARFDTLAQTLWPGPLTLILPKQRAVPELATSGLLTVALRFPQHDVALALIRAAGGAIAAPSANPFGYLSPTRAEHVREQLGEKVAVILDGGPCGIGVESSVLELVSDTPRLLRPGGMPRERIEALIGAVELGVASAVTTPLSPGQLKSHYAPRTRLMLHSRAEMLELPWEPASAWLFFDGNTRDLWLQHRHIINPGRNQGCIHTLSEHGNLATAAALLFETLYEIDHTGASAIHAQRVPSVGLGNAINDRLERAAI